MTPKEIAEALLQPAEPGMEDVHYTTQAELILARAFIDLLAKCERMEKVISNARSVNNHWNEFGPEYGHDDAQHWLYEALKQLDEPEAAPGNREGDPGDEQDL